MTTTTTTTETPAAWVGCLACYNAGRLIGEWVTLPGWDEDAWRANHPACRDHEELWCFDLEHLGRAGEMSPDQANDLAESITTAADETGAPLDAVLAYIDNGSDVDGFAESWAGEWGSLADYAEELHRDTCGSREELDRLDCWPYSCIDWERAANDLCCGGDVWTADAPGGVWVFRSV